MREIQTIQAYFCPPPLTSLHQARDKMGEIMMHQGVMSVQDLLCLSLSDPHTCTQLSHWPWFPVVMVCACCWKGLPALCVGNPAYSAYSHKHAVRQTDSGRTEGGADTRFSIMLPVSPAGVYPDQLTSPLFNLNSSCLFVSSPFNSIRGST